MWAKFPARLRAEWEDNKRMLPQISFITFFFLLFLLSSCHLSLTHFVSFSAAAVVTPETPEMSTETESTTNQITATLSQSIFLESM